MSDYDIWPGARRAVSQVSATKLADKPLELLPNLIREASA